MIYRGSGKGLFLSRTHETITLNRRDFLRLSGVGLAGVALVGIAGCGGGGTIGGGGGGGGSTFIFGRGADSVCLDPINATDGESFRVTRQIMDSLLRFKPGGFEFAPALATEIPKPENGGLSYTLKLRKGVKFHDGTEFNADAVKFNFDRWRDTKNPYHKGGGSATSEFSYYSSSYRGFDDDSVIESVDPVDEYTVRFSLKEPFGPFIANLTMSPFAIASPAAIKKNVDNFWQEPVGTGPFKFVEWERNSLVRVEANDDWWGSSLPASQGYGGPHLKEVIIKTIPDNTQRVAALSGNQLNAADGLVPDDVPSVEDQEGFLVKFRPPNTIGYLAMNNEKAPFDDPDKAKQMLKDAGAANLKTDLWYMPIPRPYMPDAKSIAQVMQQNLQKVGVSAKLVTYEWATYLTKIASGEHSTCLIGWTGDNGDPDNFLNVLLNSAGATPQNAQNFAYYKNPEVDKLFLKAQTTIDENARKDAYYKAQKILHEDAPWVPIAYVTPPLAMQETVTGLDPNPTSSEPFNTVKIEGGQ